MFAYAEIDRYQSLEFANLRASESNKGIQILIDICDIMTQHNLATQHHTIQMEPMTRGC